MARTKGVRQDIQQVLPGVRSVVVVARNYYAPRPEGPEDTAHGRTARYAWGRDYHRALRKPLQRLADHIASFEDGAQCVCCIDSGPVLEKFWAALAGVGWIGKNSLVLREDLGSWFFLGVILTTVELTPDEPLPDRCGECRACIEACPTGAIVEPRVVEAGRCISYHTIENRGEAAEKLARRFGDWVFGCDICQEVCPWNRETPTTTEKDFLPRAGHANPDLAALSQMAEETFRARFAGSPIMRAKHSGIARNVRIAWQNQERD
jgi:epoxyqueuosine reductase